MIVVAGQSDASARHCGRFAMGEFERRGGERDVGASLRKVFVKAVRFSIVTAAVTNGDSSEPETRIAAETNPVAGGVFQPASTARV